MTTSPELTRRFEAFKRHLRGAKPRLFQVFLAFGLCGGLTGYYRNTVIAWLLAPANGHLSPTGQPIVTGLTDMFSFTLHLSATVGLIGAAPVLAFHLFRFLSPALPVQVRRFLAVFLPTAVLCFLVGVAFAYWVLLPTGIRYLLGFGMGVVQPMITLNEYMDLALAMMLWLGVVFELPLAMFLLSKFGLVSHGRFWGFQPYVPIAAFALGSLITPSSDVVNVTLIGLPLIALYEVGLLLSWLARPRAVRP